jgi:menaquinone-dependent protoporphyrinogen IX oxidase
MMQGLVKEALIVYWSQTGNAQKVALSIKEGLEATGIEVRLKKPNEAADVNYFDYDLVCIGSPSIQWHPAKPIANFLTSKLSTHRKQGRIKPTAPKFAGKNALIFVTYSAPHTGLDEATPAGKYMRQFFEHIDFTVIDEWYILSEFHDSLENSTRGRMGDIRGKPTEEELAKIREDTEHLAKKYLI